MNKVILSGRLTKDVELRYTANNTPVGGFSLAVDRRVKQGEEKQADFINCVVWGKLAETASKYLSKGSKILIEGRLQTSVWESEGKRNYKTEVIVEGFEFLDTKKKEGQAQGFTETDDELPF